MSTQKDAGEPKPLASTLVDLLQGTPPREVQALVGPLLQSGLLGMFDAVQPRSSRQCSFLAAWLFSLRHARRHNLAAEDLRLLDAWTGMPGGSWWEMPGSEPGKGSLIDEWIGSTFSRHADLRSAQPEVSAVLAHAPLQPFLAWQPEPSSHWEKTNPADADRPGAFMLNNLVCKEDATGAYAPNSVLPSEVLMERGVSPLARVGGYPVAAHFAAGTQWDRFLAAGGDPLEIIPPRHEQERPRPLWQCLYDKGLAALTPSIQAWTERTPGATKAMDDVDTAKYFKRVCNTSGVADLRSAVTARKDWGTLVDAAGRNILMCLLASDTGPANARDLVVKMLDMRKARDLVHASDASGANLWHYLFSNGASTTRIGSASSVAMTSMASAIAALVRAGVEPCLDSNGRGLLVRAMLDPVSVPLIQPRHGTISPHAFEFDHQSLESVPSLHDSSVLWLCASEKDTDAAMAVFATNQDLRTRSGLVNLALLFRGSSEQIDPRWASMFLEALLHHPGVAHARQDVFDYLHHQGAVLSQAAVQRLESDLDKKEFEAIRPLLDREALHSTRSQSRSRRRLA